MRIASSVTANFSLLMDRALADAGFLRGDLAFFVAGFSPSPTGAAPLDGDVSLFSFFAFFNMV
jgi:hypothetical protein